MTSASEVAVAAWGALQVLYTYAFAFAINILIAHAYLQLQWSFHENTVCCFFNRGRSVSETLRSTVYLCFFYLVSKPKF